MADLPIEPSLGETSTVDTAEMMEANIDTDADAQERGRLKRRRQSSQHSPRRASSPSRGHDRHSGSRYRVHHRKHHRPSSPTSSSISPPTSVQKKTRRRSDAEPDHTFRGRARNRSSSRCRTRSPILEYEDAFLDNEEDVKRYRKRSAPPSRHRIDGGGELRRLRSYPNLYKEDRRDSKGEDEKESHVVKPDEYEEATAENHSAKD
ncbi:hypothetical protein PtrSN002B_005834 [Pyrenophora tritici-repentis]|uniref:PRP38-assoc multi-domain protein n=2 Tax=Pyrenophora tritici-repentis TaxID=45151 RepID=A0A2W1F787_9PLEO|nr:uncharacterized protein PTRG_11271 [Pyrenophora tritici-repentis Pt-1C-BFP]KAA8622406.1 hypothetical protein PtrV1_03712 [Pyrenophora tritici-repentis]EDU44321.1 predicted protein [Pyrenophora tritici-repentis Pt-1C-BFP]KAF7451390.1 hypothetical protein A1F99_031670 [Pyrenophora tritici-repentis]KAF7575503.1 PRP38-assoc multi-domain protein [Pyrenophora tritici-repentis]KAG9385750.1 hypothetical protein A1F94_002500 [Pyrenophora tritici-repentis]